ncbi:MAG: hypothetical protein Q4G07_03580 [Oscillospiraceae bacterium]|nr:hypothetical protein [Oscillospiraceae bacterium]
MAVAGIGTANAYATQQELLNKVAAKSAEKQEAAATDKEAEKAVDGKQDSFVHSTESTNVTYSPQTLGRTKLTSEELRDMEAARTASFQKMLESMLTKQGQKSNVNMFGKNFTVGGSDSAKAAASIAEDGEWGVNAVATRIMDMAKALSGGDASKFDTLKNAVIKGFDAAQAAWGKSKMPSITSQTYDEVMNRFDDWAKELGIQTEA